MKEKVVNFLHTRKTDIVLISIVLIMFLQALYCFSLSDSRTVLAFGCITTFLTACIYLICRVLEARGMLSIEVAFLMGALGCGLFYMLVFVPGSVPDEPYHFQSSYKLAADLMFLAPTAEKLPMRLDDVSFMEGLFASNNLSAEQYKNLAENFTLFVSQPQYSSVVPLSSFDWGSNPPYIKLPSALGIVIAHIFNLGSLPMFYLGRLFNLIFFVLLVFYAIRITPVGKNVMVVCALLPMSLHQAASYSYDPGIIGLGFLFAAMSFRAIYSTGKMTRSHKIQLAVVAALLAPCKIIYAVAVLLVLLIPQNRFSSRKQANIYKGIVFGSVLLSVLVLRAATMVQMAGIGDTGEASSLGMRGAEQGTFYSLSSVITDPLNTILLYLRTFDTYGPFYLNTLVGGSLGWFQPEIQAPLYITFVLYALLIISGQRSRDDDFVIPSSHRLLFGGLALISWLIGMLSMLIAWTFTNENLIQGVQGRYLLPLLPLVVLALRSKVMLVDRSMGVWLFYATVAVNMVYITKILTAAVSI